MQRGDVCTEWHAMLGVNDEGIGCNLWRQRRGEDLIGGERSVWTERKGGRDSLRLERRGGERVGWVERWVGKDSVRVEHRLDWDLDAKVELLAHPDIYDRAGSAGADEKRRNLVKRPLSCGETYPLDDGRS